MSSTALQPYSFIALPRAHYHHIATLSPRPSLWRQITHLASPQQSGKLGMRPYTLRFTYLWNLDAYNTDDKCSLDFQTVWISPRDNSVATSTIMEREREGDSQTSLPHVVHKPNSMIYLRTPKWTVYVRRYPGLSSVSNWLLSKVSNWSVLMGSLLSNFVCSHVVGLHLLKDIEGRSICVAHMHLFSYMVWAVGQSQE